MVDENRVGRLDALLPVTCVSTKDIQLLVGSRDPIRPRVHERRVQEGQGSLWNALVLAVLDFPDGALETLTNLLAHCDATVAP